MKWIQNLCGDKEKIKKLASFIILFLLRCYCLPDHKIHYGILNLYLVLWDSPPPSSVAFRRSFINLLPCIEQTKSGQYSGILLHGHRENSWGKKFPRNLSFSFFSKTIFLDHFWLQEQAWKHWKVPSDIEAKVELS